MARARKKIDKKLSYSIEPHPKGLGFVVYEQFGKSNLDNGQFVEQNIRYHNGDRG